MTTKVIFHIDEADKWEMVIANLTNLCKSIDTQDAAVELLANSNAVLSFIRNWRQDTRNKRAKRLRRPFYIRLAGGLQFHGSLWACGPCPLYGTLS